MYTPSRIHASLDGDLPREHLSHSEAEILAELESDLAGAVALLRPPPLDMRASVMDRIPAGRPAVAAHGRVRRTLAAAWAWLSTPRPVTLQLRPSYGFAAIALLVVLANPPIPQEEAAQDPVAVASPGPIYVQFRLDAAEASSVALAGSFSGWEPAVEMLRSAHGVWTATVPLAPGVHDYLFVVDGAEWVADPAAREVDDHFGGTNSRLYLTGPGRSI